MFFDLQYSSRALKIAGTAAVGLAVFFQLASPVPDHSSLDPGKPPYPRALPFPGFFLPRKDLRGGPTSYLGVFPGFTVSCRPKALTFHLPPKQSKGEQAGSFRMRFLSAPGPAVVQPRGALEGKFHFFKGKDPGSWKKSIPAYRSLLYKSLYRGIDLVLKPGAHGIEYDVLVSPEASLEDFAFLVEGNGSVGLGDDGNLVVAGPGGRIVQSIPSAWEILPDGTRRPLHCEFALLGPKTVGIRCGDRRPGRPLVVDPEITYSTFLGGTRFDTAWNIFRCKNGDILVAGTTDSLDFPTTPGAFSRKFHGASNWGTHDIFVLRWNPKSARMVFGTYIGGSKEESLHAAVLDGKENLLLGGQTQSSDYPVTQGVMGPRIKGTYDGFVTILDSSGSKLLHSTYLVGASFDNVLALALGPSGALFAGGYTASSDFPTTPGAWQRIGKNLRTSHDGFIARLKPDLSGVLYSTYLGGSRGDSVDLIALDAKGRPTLTGVTRSSDFPTTPFVFNRSFPGNETLYLARFKADLSSPEYSTFLGVMDVHPRALALDPGGGAFVAGHTGSLIFPVTANAIRKKPFRSGQKDGFLFHMGPRGRNLIFSSYIGGSCYNLIYSIFLEGNGIVTLAGETDSPDFPVTPDAPDKVFKGRYEGFLTQVDTNAGAYLFSTFLGGDTNDGILSLFSSGPGKYLACGFTDSKNFPVTSNALRKVLWGFGDGFALEMDIRTKGFLRFGRSTPACKGPEILFPLAPPAAGEKSFGLACTNAPPYAFGVLMVTPGRLSSPTRVAGVEIWVDPNSGFIPLAVASDMNGYSAYPMPVPASARGCRFYGQFLWFNPSYCGGANTFSSSLAAEVTIQ